MTAPHPMSISGAEHGLDTSETSPAALAGLRSGWTLAFVLGELVGFIPPAITGAALGAAGAPDVALVIGLSVAGSLEGATIGWTQSRVLRRYAPQVSARRWIGFTALAAAFAWFVGMGGGALMGSSIAGPWLLAVMIPLWVAALLGMGFAQWLVLREAVARSARWIWVNALAWLIGVMIPVAALTAAPNSWPMPAHAVVAVAAAVVMGTVVGSITGRTLRRLLSRNTA